MALNATTLTSAIGTNDTSFAVGSVTGITAPIFSTGVGLTYLMVEQEFMLVTGVTGLVVSVQRGVLGSCAVAHGASCPVVAGLPTDFTGVPISIKAQQDFYPNEMGFSAPVAVAANVVAASGPFFHLTGTTIVKTITVPPGYVQGGSIGIVFDGSGAGLTWDATGNINVAGTSGTAGTMVYFVFDAGITKWIPSRIL